MISPFANSSVSSKTGIARSLRLGVIGLALFVASLPAFAQEEPRATRSVGARRYAQNFAPLARQHFSGAGRPATMLTEQPRRGLLVPGFGLFLGTYGAALIGAATTTAFAQSQLSSNGVSCMTGLSMNFVPVFGPLLAAARWPNYYLISSGGLYSANAQFDCPNYTGTVYATEAFLAIGQLSGVVLMTLGALLREAVPVVHSFRLVPGTLAGPAGLSAGVSF